MKNLRELGTSPFHYIVPIIPRSFPVKLVKGENFVLADLVNSISGSSLQVSSSQARVAEGALVEFVQSDQLPLAKRDRQPAS